MRNFVIAIAAMVLIAVFSIIAGGGTISVSCTDLEAFTSSSYWRGTMGQRGAPHDWFDACWRKGIFEYQAKTGHQ